MTLKLDLFFVYVYHHTENKFSCDDTDDLPGDEEIIEETFSFS